MGGMGLMGPVGVRHHRPRRRRARHGRDQGVGALLAHLGSRGLALPTWAHHRHATVWGHQACQPRLVHLRPGVCGLALRDRHGRLVAVGSRRPGQGHACGVEVMAAPVTAVVGPTPTAMSRHTSSQPSGCTVSSVRPRVTRWHLSARTPSRHHRSTGGLAKHWGVKDKARWAHPQPLRILPATASP